MADIVAAQPNPDDKVSLVYETRRIRQVGFVHPSFQIASLGAHLTRRRRIDGDAPGSPPPGGYFPTQEAAQAYVAAHAGPDVQHEIVQHPRWHIQGWHPDTCGCYILEAHDSLVPDHEKVLIPIHHLVCDVHKRVHAKLLADKSTADAELAGMVETVHAENRKKNIVHHLVAQKLGVEPYEIIWAISNEDNGLHIVASMMPEQKADVLQHLADNGHADVEVHSFSDYSVMPDKLLGAFLSRIDYRPSEID